MGFLDFLFGAMIVHEATKRTNNRDSQNLSFDYDRDYDDRHDDCHEDHDYDDHSDYEDHIYDDDCDCDICDDW